MTRLLALALVVVTACLGCRGRQEAAPALILATTTSARDSGLLDALLPPFEAQHGIEVKVVAVGTGQAIELARRGDADVLLTHAPELEAQFVADGFSDARRPVMWNDFLFVGPRQDPGGLREASSATGTLARIAESQSLFISRGDKSGTHVKELALWRQAGLEPAGDWYLESGAGMAATLRIAHEKQAYTLADRATFVAQGGALDLVIVHEGDPLLRNDYSVLVVSPAKHPHVHAQAAEAFADYLVSPAAQQVIAAFGRDRFGQPMFFPNIE